MEYCNILFNSDKKSKLDRVDKFQTKCIRIVENCYDVSLRAKESTLCNEYKLHSLQTRRDIQLACTIYRLSEIDCYIDHTVY